MKKIILIIVIVLVLGALGIAFWYFGYEANIPAGGGGGQLPPAETGTSPSVISATSTPTGDTITIGTSEGSVTMENFYKNAVAVFPDGSGADIAQSSTYNINYTSLDSSFQIALLQTPIMTTRAQAEAAFLRSLGISEKDACKLKVTVETPVGVDPQDAGVNFGLSFCNQALGTQP